MLVTRNMEGIDAAPLQLYISAMVFAPQKSRIRTLFQHEIPKTISRFPVVDLDWGPLFHTLDCCDYFILQFSPDGQDLATSMSSKVKLWNTTTWELRRTLECSSQVNCVTFAPCSNSLATGLEDGSVIIWDTVKWEERYRQSYDRPIQSIALSREDILAVAADFQLRVSDISLANEYLDVSIDVSLFGPNLTFPPRGNLLVATCEQEIQILETENWRLAHSLPFRNAEQICFSPNGDLLSIIHDAKIILLETENWTTVRKVSLVLYNGVSFSPDGCLLAAAACRHSIEIISLRDHASHTYFKGHANSARCVSFSPTGGILASSAQDCLVKLWSTPADILSYHPQETPHWDFITRVVISPAGVYAASHTLDGDLKIWNAQEGEIKFSSSLGIENAWSGHEIIKFSPDNQWFLSWGYEKPLTIWNTTTGVMELEDETLGGSEINISFNEEGLLLTYGEKDEKLLTQFRSQLRPCEFEAYLRVEESWIVEAASGERIMWLLQEYRPEFCDMGDHFVCDVHDRTVVWGTGSGNVYFMEVGPDTHLQVNG